MLNVKKTLLMLMLLVALLMMLGSTTTFWLMNQSSQVLSQHVQEDVETERQLTRLLQEALGLRLAVLSKTLNPRAEQPDRSYARALEEIDSAVSHLRTQEGTFDENLIALEQWMEQAAAMMSLAQQANLPAAMQLTRETEAPAWQAFRVPLLEAITLQSELTQTAYEHAEALRQRAILGSGVLMVFMILVVLSVLFVFYRRLTQALGGELNQAVRLAESIAAGRLNQDARQTEAIQGSLIGSLYTMQTHLRQLVESVRHNADQVSTETLQLVSRAESSVQLIEKQSQETDSIASAVTQMSASAQEVSTNVTQTAGAATHAHEAAEKSMRSLERTLNGIQTLSGYIQQTSKVIDQLKQRSSSVNQMAEAIQDIAEQTNLLALNASIEAARAGEHGRGFAVVADEVRSLASRSGQSSTEITTIIQNLISETEEAVQAMQASHEETKQLEAYAHNSSEDIQTLFEAVRRIAEMADQIASAAEEQSLTTEDISHHMTSVTDKTQQVSQAFTETQQRVHSLRLSADQLLQQVATFKL